MKKILVCFVLAISFQTPVFADDENYEFLKSKTPTLQSGDGMDSLSTTQLSFPPTKRRMENSGSPKVREYSKDGKRIKWKYVRSMIL